MLLMDLFARQESRHGHRKQMCGPSRGEKLGEAESSADTCIRPYVTWYLAGSRCVARGLSPGSVMTWVGGMGVGGLEV